MKGPTMIEVVFADFDNMHNEMLVKQLSMLKERYKSKLILFDGPMPDSDETKAGWCKENRPGMFDDYCFSFGGQKLVDTIITYCEESGINKENVMFVSDNRKELALARENGMETRSPKAMAEAYRKAVDMLRKKKGG